MTALPFDILLGIYLGVLTGIIPALVSGVLGFLFKYITDVSIPGLGVVVLALAIAGVNGGLLALNDPTIRASENAAAILTAIIVVLMLALYAHAQGDTLGAAAPKRLTIKSLRDRTLNTDVIELVGGRNQVRLTVLGAVSDIEGYPPLPAELRREIGDGEWAFPADLPIAELERRFADRLRSEFDLADVAVDLDTAARARVAAAPPMGATSRRVPAGKRAVSLTALVPSGIARGESVRIVSPETTATGTVVAARSATTPPSATPTPGGDDDTLTTDGGEEPTPLPAAATTTGGEGRITVAVSRSAATALLSAGEPQVVVQSRGTRREFELVSLLRRSGVRFRRLTVAAGGPLDGHTIGAVGVRDAYDVLVLAANHERWQVAPGGDQLLSAGDQLYVIGTAESLDRFAEVAT